MPDEVGELSDRAGRGTTLARLTIASAALLLAPAASARAGDMALVEVGVVDIAAGRLEARQTVLVADGSIAAVGPTGEVTLPSAIERVDGRGRYLVPGFWDMHVHALWSDEAADSFLPLFLEHGVLGVRDLGGSLDVIEQVRRRVETGVLRAPHLYAAGPILDGPDPTHPEVSWALTTREEGRQAVERLHAAGVDLVKVYTQLPRDAFLGVAERARFFGLPLVGHLPGEIEVEEAIDAGMRTIEHLRAELGGFCEPDEPRACERAFALMRRAGVWQVPTLLARQVRAARRSDRAALERWSPRLPSAVVAEWRAAAEISRRERRRRRQLFEGELWMASQAARSKVGFLVGSDTGNPFVVPGASLHEEMELLVTAGWSEAEVLRAATLDAARHLGIVRTAGSIAVGKRADLVLLAENPLEDIRHTRTIERVFLAGDEVVGR